jgi:hypothetical protein
MARYAASVESQAAQLGGAPVTTTFNGYFAALVGGTNGCVLRRVQLGVRTTATPTSQQQTIGIYRQSVRVAGSGFSTTTGNKLDPYSATSGISGIDITTATAAGTTGPTIAGPLYRVTFNTQSTLDLPFELLEQFRVANATTDGIAFVNLGSALPASHLFTLTVEWEE